MGTMCGLGMLALIPIQLSGVQNSSSRVNIKEGRDNLNEIKVEIRLKKSGNTIGGVALRCSYNLKLPPKKNKNYYYFFVFKKKWIA